MTGVAQMMLGCAPGYAFTAAIAANTQNYNVRAAALASGWDGAVPLLAEITVEAGVVVGSSSTGAYAFDTGAGFP